MNEKVNDKLQKALNSSDTNEEHVVEKGEVPKNENVAEDKVTIETIVTTEEEIEGYVFVKLLLKDEIDSNRVHYRDNKSYFNVLLDDSIRKWVCRLGFNTANKYIQINDEEKTIYKLNNVNEISLYKDKILEVAKQFQ